ncbi:phosphopantetheine-binding protein [Saccharopolyspora sp. NPDC050389]|uniref:acyl carrier protein n=1 Tax=Saccharopolyspora sp. NPDC050389 TaxID=3155516 RepID=UPI0033FA901A
MRNEAALHEIFQGLGVVEEIQADTRLQADLGLDSTEITALELELERRFGVRIDLWGATDFSVAELDAVIERR